MILHPIISVHAAQMKISTYLLTVLVFLSTHVGISTSTCAIYFSSNKKCIPTLIIMFFFLYGMYFFFLQENEKHKY